MCTSPGAPSTLRQAIERIAELRAQQIQIDAGLGQDADDAAAPLLEHRRQHVHGLDELMIAADGERLRIGQRLLELGRQFVHAHY